MRGEIVGCELVVAVGVLVGDINRRLTWAAKLALPWGNAFRCNRYANEYRSVHAPFTTIALKDGVGGQYNAILSRQFYSNSPI